MKKPTTPEEEHNPDPLS